MSERRYGGTSLARFRVAKPNAIHTHTGNGLGICGSRVEERDIGNHSRECEKTQNVICFHESFSFPCIIEGIDDTGIVVTNTKTGLSNE
jgi:hypothetical protein